MSSAPADLAAALIAELANARPTEVVAAPGAGAGYWAGAPSAVADGDLTWLAYRLRRPEGAGRGYANVLARSQDGIHFRPVASISSDDFGAASLERPALVSRPGGGWRLYVSCSTPGTKHWWVEALDADTVEDLPTGTRTVILPGDESECFKDVVVDVRGGRWRMWACRHPLDGGDDAADRMSTVYFTSGDGLHWQRSGTCLAPADSPEQAWAARGLRLSDVLALDEGWLALFDGRAHAVENFHERTGVAVGRSPRSLTPVAGPVPQEYGVALRYVSLVPTKEGLRAYYETVAPDGSHHLVTALMDGF